MMRRSAISVGRRLAALVGAEALTAGALLVLAFASLHRLTANVSFMDRYALAPVEGIAFALERAAQLETIIETDRTSAVPDVGSMRHLNDQVADFLARYRSDWAVAGNTSEDAKRFRAELERDKRLDIVDQEATTIDAVERDVGRIRASLLTAGTGREWVQIASNDVQHLRTTLRQLLIINVAYVNVAVRAFDLESRRTRNVMLVVGIAGIVLAAALGMQVHHAIAPRIARLVSSVKKFEESGVHERILEQGRDEIAVLANALDTGFAAIATRDRERERFLAVVAHELKTPMTSILGFTGLALDRPEDAAVRTRALEAVRRHAARLGHLIDDLLLAASTRTGTLPFRPQHADLESLTRRVISEVEVAVPGQTFALESQGPAHLLADERLLAQAIWSALTYAAMISEPKQPVVARVSRSLSRVTLEIRALAPTTSVEQIEDSFAPFASVQYEDGGTRSGAGLFLCREITRLHGGGLTAKNVSDTQRALVMTLPG